MKVILWMVVGMFAMGALALSPIQAATVYKCKDAQGKVMFSQRPCRGAALAIEVSPATPAKHKAKTSTAKPLQFSGNDVSDFYLIAGEIKVAKIAASNCAWGLEVEQNILKCAGLLRYSGENSPLDQIYTRWEKMDTKQLVKSVSGSDLREATRDIREVQKARHLLNAYIRSL